MNDLERKLVGELIGLARATDGNEHLITESITDTVAEVLTANVTDEARSAAYSAKIEAAKREMVPDCFQCANPCGRTAAFDLSTLEGDVGQTKLAILEALRTIAASPRSPEANLKLYRGLVILGLEGYSPAELTALFSE